MIDFKIKGLSSNITVYTTSQIIIWGFICSPEHPLVENLLDEKKVEVEEYIKLASNEI